MADVNLSVEVQNRGVQEATAAIERLTASGRSAARVINEKLEPQPRSGRQERLENLWNRYV